VELIDENMDWLSDDSWVIAQIAPKEYKELALENLQEFQQRKYGTTLLVFYERREASQKESE
jgi:16S rRNA G966 N2-methylase RsmD